MIKTRLVRLLSHTKKYIVQTIIWQWIALLGQIASIFAIGRLVDGILAQTVIKNNVIMTNANAIMIVTVVRIVHFVFIVIAFRSTKLARCF